MKSLRPAERHSPLVDRLMTAGCLSVIVTGLALLVIAGEQGWVWT